ncbi:hypothetical protein [Aquimarina sp. 2304DJ70-9]|uniref:hypothetical protein n=1 Tax=Aquimarina penaris TaxID=3231044 RepID=UPI0034635136
MRNTLKTAFSIVFIIAVLFFITLVITSKKKSNKIDSTNATINTEVFLTIRKSTALSFFITEDVKQNTLSYRLPSCSDKHYLM